MSPKTGSPARLFSLVASSIIFTIPAAAENRWSVNRVTGLDQDVATGCISLKLANGSPLGPPSLKYLPPNYGLAIMAADFPGIQYKLAPQIIRPLKSVDPTLLIKVSQIQESPPILRVAFAAKSVKTLQALSFTTTPQALYIKVSGAFDPVPSVTTNSVADSAIPSSTVLAATKANSPSIAVAPNRVIAPAENLRTSMGANTTASSSSGLPLPAPAAAPSESSRNRAESRPGYYDAPLVVPNQNMGLSSAAGATSKSASPSRTIAPPAVASSKTVQTAPKPVLTASSAPTPAPSQAPAQFTPTGEKRGLLSKLFSRSSADTANRESAKQESANRASDTTFGAATSVGTTSTGTLNKPIAAVNANSATGALAGATAPVSAQADQTDPTEPTPPLAVPKQVTISIKRIDVKQAPDESLNIAVEAEHKLKFKTFRLHDPERFVIDFPNAPEIGMASLPPLDTSKLVRGVRVGSPTIDSARMVLDLPAENISVDPHLTGDGLTLLIALNSPNKVLQQLTATDSEYRLKRPGASHATPDKPLLNITAVIDAGHGGSDPGAQRESIQEKEITLGITEHLQKLLESAGAKVVMTRSDDTFVSLEDRVKITRAIEPDIFLSVHINALESNNDVHGIETYYFSDQSKPFADIIQKALVNDLSAPDRNVRRARFYVINRTPIPSVLAEVGFISNKDERDSLTTSDYQERIAGALAEGIASYLGRNMTSKNPVNSGTANASGHSRNSVDSNNIERGTSLEKDKSVKSKLAGKQIQQAETVK